MNKTARLPRTTRGNAYDKRFKVTQMILEENKAISKDVNSWKIACFTMTVATTLATINFFAK